MSSPSLVIRNGTIVDGSGGDPYEADLAVVDGKIAAIGGDIPKGTEEIDARGKLVTPGFVDVHTHYDAQVTWSDRLSPSSWNGATTVLFGNCGVGFAPCHEDQHDMLINLMEGVEDIPEVVLSEGLPWNWHSFPDFLDAIAARSYDVDVAAQVPHAALRVYVMGERGANREPATEQDRQRMARAHRRRAARRGTRLLDLAHAQSPRRRRPQHPDLARRGSRADRDRPRHARGRHRLAADRVGLRGPGGRDRTVPPAGAGIEPARHHHPDAVRRPPRWLARADVGDRRGQRRGTAHHRAGPLAPDQRAARPRAFAKPVHGPAELQAHRPSAVPGAPGPAAPARVPGPHPGRGVRGQPARPAASSAGIACIRSAIRRTTSPRPRAASPPGRRAKAARPKRWPTTCCSSATARGSSICPSPTMPAATSTWCAR